MNKVSYRVFIGTACCLFSVVIIFLGLFTHGWIIRESEEDGIEIKANMGLRETEGTYGGIKVEFDNSDLADESERSKKANDAGLTAYIILWIALPICFAAMIIGVIISFGKMNGKFGVISGFSGGFLIILSVILYVIIIPSLRDTDSFGWTFYIVIIGGIIQSVGGGLMIGIKRETPLNDNTGQTGYGPSVQPQFQGQYPPQQFQGQYPPQQFQGQYPPQQFQGQHPPQQFQGQHPPQQFQGQHPPQQFQGQYPPQQFQGQYPPQ